MTSRSREEWRSMRLAEQIEQVGKQYRSEDADHDGPPHELLVSSAVRPSHAGQEVVAVVLFVFSHPKHNRSSGCRRCIVKADAFGKPTNRQPQILACQAVASSSGRAA